MPNTPDQPESMTHCQDCADKDQEIKRLKERIALDATQIKGITKRSDKYANELYDLKNAKPSPAPMGANRSHDTKNEYR